MGDEEPVSILTEEESWELLGDEEFGRLAFRLADEVHIVPINYAVMKGRLFFRTAAGSKLLSAAMGAEVALETDRVQESRAVSVVVRGTARVLPEDEAHVIDELPDFTWVPTLKYDVVEIVPGHVTGRRFDLVAHRAPR